MQNVLVLVFPVWLCGCIGVWPGDWDDWQDAHKNDTSHGQPDDTDADADTDTDADADTDTDTDTDADADADADADCVFGEISYHSDWTIEMAMVCAGSFNMGSPDAEVGHDFDEIMHEVVLNRAFYVSTHEIDQTQFEKVCYYQPSGHSSCSECPVENLSWSEAANYANLLSLAEGLPECFSCSGKDEDLECRLADEYSTPYECDGYRLPTEAEWEYAARAGSETAYSNGGDLFPGDSDGDGTDDLDECSGNLMLQNSTYLDDIAWYCGNANTTVDVGNAGVNDWGLYDVHGNVREWCHDWWDGSPYTEEPMEDPWGDKDGDSRVIRGGAFSNSPRMLRSAFRSKASPDSRYESIGFRIVKNAP